VLLLIPEGFLLVAFRLLLPEVAFWVVLGLLLAGAAVVALALDVL
jgi:hypothetical protein